MDAFICMQIAHCIISKRGKGGGLKRGAKGEGTVGNKKGREGGIGRGVSEGGGGKRKISQSLLTLCAKFNCRILPVALPPAPHLSSSSLLHPPTPKPLN